MTTGDPISLGEAKRLAPSADTILLRATRTADLETPIGAFLRLDDGGPAYLLESVEGGERLGRYSFLGVGPRRLLQVRDGQAAMQTRPVSVDRFDASLPIERTAAVDPLTALRTFIPRRRVVPVDGMPRFTGGAVGALAYDAVSAFEPTVPLPDADPVDVPTAAFIETDLVLVFDHLTHTLSAIASLHTDAPDLEGRYAIAERAIHEALERTARPSAAELSGGVRRAGATTSDGRDGPAVDPRHVRTSLGREQYEQAVRVAKDAIAAGEAIQVVLARRQSIELPIAPNGTPLDGIELYRALRRVNPSPYLYYVRMPGFEVVGASPELLLQVEGDRLTTHPIAGTRPRGRDTLEDQVLAEQLQKDPKERAEHVMLVDLGRNDLGRVARPGTVTVTKYMEVEKYSHVLHLVSHVEARLRRDADALDALRAVFPAGTLSGAPKVRAMQLIAAAERERRGLYGGAVGYLGYDGNLDTAITIRSAVLKDGIAHVHTGAGIVAGSVPEKEFEETEHKAAAVRRAIELAAATVGAKAPEAATAGSRA
jgi:anthranilate synthase component 1